MPRYIDAEETTHVSVFNEETEDYKVETCTIEEALDKYTDEGCPVAADVVSVRHGEWIPDREISRTMLISEEIAIEYDSWHCSCCGTRYKEYVLAYDYCPHCGALMGKGGNVGDIISRQALYKSSETHSSKLSFFDEYGNYSFPTDLVIDTPNTAVGTPKPFNYCGAKMDKEDGDNEHRTTNAL